MLDERFIILGAVISILGTLDYVRDVIRGKARPNRVSWFVWSLAPLLAFSAQLSKGVQLVALVTFVSGFGPLLVFIASFFNKKSLWKVTKQDLICGALAIIGLIAWALTKEGYYAIAFGIAADLFAAIPTLKKSYTHPESENYVAFLTSGIGTLLGFLTIKVWNFETYSFPLYLLLINTTFYILIRFKLGKRLAR